MKRFFENLHDHIILLIYEYISYSDFLNLLVNIDKKELIYNPLSILPLQTCSCHVWLKSFYETKLVSKRINVNHGLAHSYAEYFYQVPNLLENIDLLSYHSQRIEIVTIGNYHNFMKYDKYDLYNAYPIILPKLHTIIIYSRVYCFKYFMNFFKINKNTIHTLFIENFRKNYKYGYLNQYDLLRVLNNIKTLILDCQDNVKLIHICNMMVYFPLLEKIVIIRNFKYKYKKRNFIEELLLKFKNIKIILSHTDPNVNTIINTDVQKYPNALYSSFPSYYPPHLLDKLIKN